MATNNGIDEKLFLEITSSIAATSFYNLLGIYVEELAPGQARLGVIPDEKHVNPLGIVHGGLLMTLMDAAMGNAVRSLGIKGVTADISNSFTGSARLGEQLVAEGKVVKAGSNLIFAQAGVMSGDRVIGYSKGTFYKIGVMEMGDKDGG